ncbi:LTA synthase family protein [Azomonas macrocytogenes]|uniref:Phosphoglycerol transferase MdoB-like AlkP superfamily enzyme n=1 Tax=Azomonas macrocytogenes TaxID=69962 RepID=A0A839T723_AZOMA|nr:LTA synthase family protein [Azomonas macrocytogenes]MBB3105307.1 phosphoglycerol transferase MdoB-like AlkP superfamily enzyme [Azomonas macrocytogenes]
MPILRSAPLRYLALMLGCWMVLFSLTRLGLMLYSWGDAVISYADLLPIMLTGLSYDLGFLACATIPLVLYLLACPKRLWQQRWHRFALHLLFFASLYLMLFCALAEWVFWIEFGVRFNFIAVDYLIYSDEVINNILESYPVYPLLTMLAALVLAIAWALHRPLERALEAPLPSRKKYLLSITVLCLTATSSLWLLDQQYPREQHGNAYQRELASNGPWQFFAAFRNNELDYAHFYQNLPDQQVATTLRTEVGEPNAQFIGNDPMDIRRRIDNPGVPRKTNVILVTIESLSLKYLGQKADGSHSLTPNLDRLRGQSLFFSNVYATGTRTDRGLEAITLSVPPTPGRSIIKRLGRESGYGGLGQQLAYQGYDSVFLYGGRGYFDNMNAFFRGNGYRIVDQTSTVPADIHFSNAWGMADEDLYALALREADADHAKGQSFLLQLMTTSNHRPYTYPEQRIDIASGKGREGAVQYTDWAIGHFLAAAREKPWFDNTLFIFVADHCAGSAGKEDLPVANYRIPLFVYAPGLIEPHEDQQLASQIDIAPTIMGLLNLDYVSTFFGRNLLLPNTLPPRALIGNYQNLGLFDGQDLAILSPRQGLRRHDEALGKSQERQVTQADELIRRNIAYYQAASHDFQQRLLNWQPFPSEPTKALSHR